jgi:5-methylcytosine-specific restriction endonuclease McrA
MPIKKSQKDMLELSRRWTAMLCQHPQLQLCRRTLKSGSIAIVHQCLSCGQQQKSPLKRLPEHDRLPIFDENLLLDYTNSRNQQWRSLVREADQKAYEEWTKNYAEYLRTPEWAERRKLVLERENYLCQGCRKFKATQAHHTTYKHVGEEFLFQLIALCRDCHERFHSDFIESLKPDEATFEDTPGNEFC